MSRIAALAGAALLLLAIGCDGLPGKPSESDRYVHPDTILDFDTLYAQNCSGCHGAHGKLGPALALDSPLYLALVPPAVLVDVIANGVDGTPMPAFAQSQGGTLTGAQVEAVARGLRQRWGSEKAPPLPPYRAALGDAGRGARTFGEFCARCHGSDGRGGEGAGSLVDPAYLGLVSDQALRTSVIVGRADLGSPDWRSYVPGRPMTDRQIADVVAWLAAQRPRYPGQPYAPPTPGRPR